MNKPDFQRKNLIASLFCTAFGAALVPSVALAAEADLMRKIDALQQELQALKAQVNAQATTSGGGGGGVSAPSGFEMSVYGVGHISGDHVDVGGAVAAGFKQKDSYIHSSSSRLGFKGSQDLGGGMAALFQFETGVDVTGNNGGDGNPGGAAAAGGGTGVFTGARDSFVGLKGNFGKVTVGRQSAIEQWLYDYNLFGDQIGDLGNIWGDLPGRFNKSIKYSLPAMGGLNLNLTYAPQQGTDNGDNFLAKADYATGGLKLGLALGKFGSGAAGLPDNDVSALTASYGTDRFSIGGGYQHESDMGGINGRDQNKYTLGASFNVGSSGTIKLQYARANDMGGTTQTSGNQWALGYDHAWRKDTTIYIAYAKTNNDLNAGYRADNWGHGTNGVPATVASGNDPSALSIGLVYKFDVGLLGKR